MPLSGLRVLELANVLAGPLVGQFCAELGADVIKVEAPGTGDPTRGWFLPGEDPSADVSAYFSCANWGKRSIAVDLATDEGRRLVHALVARVDVAVVSFKPGVEGRLGVDVDTFRRLNPRLIDLRVSAFGDGDPRPGFDAIVQAESGFTAINGDPSGPPTKMPVALVDVLAAHQLKEALLLALLRRERTGEGATISTSLLGSAVASLVNQASNYLHAGVVPVRMGSEHPNIVPYGRAYATSDGHQVVLAVGTDRQFRALTDALQLEDVAADARLATNAGRVERRGQLNDLLDERFAALTFDEAVRRLTEHGVPFGRVQAMDRVFDARASQAQLFEGGRGVRSVAFDGDLAGRRQLSPPPRLDQHGAEIRGWLED